MADTGSRMLGGRGLLSGQGDGGGAPPKQKCSAATVLHRPKPGHNVRTVERRFNLQVRYPTVGNRIPNHPGFPGRPAKNDPTPDGHPDFRWSIRGF